MIVHSQGEEYLVVEIPLTTQNVDLGVPYTNNIRAAVPIENSPNILVINFIECKEIIPNSKEFEYKIVGRQSQLNWKMPVIKGKEYVIILVKKK